MTFNPLEIVVAIQLDKVELLKRFVPSVIPFDGRLSVHDSSVPFILHENASLLSFAVQSGAKEVIDFLLQNGASTEIKDNISFNLFLQKIRFLFLIMAVLLFNSHQQISNVNLFYLLLIMAQISIHKISKEFLFLFFNLANI